MILMAVDHVRVYSGLPAGGPEAGIFLMRWVTHFCAPAFVFLAGTSAYLSGIKHGGLSKTLLTRGLWLIVLELTVLRVAWTFNFDFAHYEMAGVIWVIGCCMIIMAGCVKMPVGVIGGLGVALIGLHNLMDPYVGALTASFTDLGLGGLWKILYLGFWDGPILFGPDGPSLIVLYSIIPWIGVMAAGYGFGIVLKLDADRRNRMCLVIGFGATGIFLLLRALNIYGDPRPWPTADLPALFSFLNTSKYPASLLFLLMTLGPAIALMPLLERARGTVAGWIRVFGRVPFFYYMLHIPLIHVLAIVVSYVSTGHIADWLFTNHPMGSPSAPEGYVWSLPTLYAVFAVAIVVLYLPCRWFADVKSRRNDWWLTYL